MGGLQTFPLSYLGHRGEEGVDVVYRPVEIQWNLVHVPFEGLVALEHGDVPDAAQG